MIGAIIGDIIGSRFEFGNPPEPGFKRLSRYLVGIKNINQKKIITFVVWNSPSYYY